MAERDPHFEPANSTVDDWHGQQVDRMKDAAEAALERSRGDEAAAERDFDRRRRGPAMKSRRAAIAVEPRGDGRWAVQTDGSRRAVRVFDRKEDAVDDARARAVSRGSELVVKGADGRIQSKDSHGHDDPYSPG